MCAGDGGMGAGAEEDGFVVSDGVWLLRIGGGHVAVNYGRSMNTTDTTINNLGLWRSDG